MWKWLKEKYPERKIIMNFSQQPTHLYVDAVDIEAGSRTDKLMMDVLKIYNTPVINLYYPALFAARYNSAPNWPILYSQDIMRILSYGATYGGQGAEFGYLYDEYSEEMGADFQKRMEGVAGFSAKANSVPWVTESHAISIEPEIKVTGSVWADSKNLMVAIFNDRDETTAIKAKIDKNILTKYGQEGKESLRFTVHASNGFPRPDNSFSGKVSGGDMIIEGKLGSKELLLVE